jgi:hypothetical protein
MTHMSQEYGTVSTSLDELESAIVDPFIQRVVDDAKVFNALINEQPPTEDEAREIIVELDSRLGDMIGSTVRVTGWVSYRDDEQQTKVKFIEDFRAQTNGFYIREIPGSYDPDASQELVYCFIARKSLVGGFENTENDPTVGLYASLQDTYVEYTGMSTERAAAWIASIDPDLLEDIQIAAYNGEGSEAGSLLALKDINFGERVDLKDQLNQKSIEIYLKDLINIDDSVPYEASVNGLVTTVPYGREYEPQTNTVRDLGAMLYLDGLLFRPADTEDPDSAIELHVSCLLVAANRSEQQTRHYIPLSSFDSLESSRVRFYGTQQ